ncbi:Citrate transporter [Methanococcus vannielii SB]|uniref:Citrate transporter n=1 Tax=Methanococcus vannielii (strain ATCC 35089 / DSM 1224 / JCM 13029 / OCM 148 / SB) TaxID=406327 RepID=A6US88_METVS|nr:SLC13 family permease [Methanococcus vannielii]ABR55360.1 Citrate transporter [Methanococcus vannielii SB]
MVQSFHSFEKIVASFVIIFLIGFLMLRTKQSKTPVWVVMALSSSIMVFSNLVPPDEIINSIDFEVILFLLGMFSIVAVIEQSGLLAYSISKIIKFAKNNSVYKISIFLSLGVGIFSAFLINDTLAFMGAPIIFALARVIKIDPKPLFFVMAFAITIGSVMSPIGNPQNMLITTQSGLKAPFLEFFLYLGIPTLLNLLITPIIILRSYRIKNDKKVEYLNTFEGEIKNKNDAVLGVLALLGIITALIVNDILSIGGNILFSNRGVIPFVVATLTYFFLSNPRNVLRGIDFGAIIFFITMFITMNGVWKSGLFQGLFNTLVPGPENVFESYFAIVFLSLTVSQFISNVPFTKLFTSYLILAGYTSNHTYAWLSLSMASTIAGNLTILGAASNIIILEGLESRYRFTTSFFEFLKLGVVVTLVNLAIYSPFLIFGAYIS